MIIANVEHGPEGSEHRTFECRKCNFSDTRQMASDPSQVGRRRLDIGRTGPSSGLMLNWRVDRGRGLKIPPHPLALFGWAESQAPKATTKRSGDCDTRNLEAKSKRV